MFGKCAREVSGKIKMYFCNSKNKTIPRTRAPAQQFISLNSRYVEGIKLAI